MKEYKVVYQDITSIISRDLPKAEEGLEVQVNQLMTQGWTPQGGMATVQAGAGIYLLQALTR